MNEYQRKLLKHAKEGCISAFEELVEPHQVRIYNFMLKIIGNEFEACRLAQDVFVKVFESLTAMDDNGSFTLNDIYRTAEEIGRSAACLSKKIS